jgi:hypothetical protein
MIDVHHTILPLTAQPKPDANAMMRASIPLQTGGQHIFSPTDMVCHCAAHLIADGDLSGGLRNLWDMNCLLSEFAESDADFWQALDARAAEHGLAKDVRRAVRLSAQVFGTEILADWDRPQMFDGLYIRRMLARDEWGRGSAKLTRFAFYVRSHWLRMPPLMLAAHLWTKWRR